MFGKPSDGNSSVEETTKITGKVWVEGQKGDKDIKVNTSTNNRFNSGIDTPLSGVTVNLNVKVAQYKPIYGYKYDKYEYKDCGSRNEKGEWVPDWKWVYDSIVYSDNKKTTGNEYRNERELVRGYERIADKTINTNATTNGMGEYNFNVGLKTYKWTYNGTSGQISEYILGGGAVTFKYNGVSYIQTIPAESYKQNTSSDIYSNATESGRGAFNDKFKTVNLNNTIAANAYANFSGGRSKLGIQTNGVKNGSTEYQIPASTTLEQVGDSSTTVSENTIRVNLGLLTREIDISLSTQVDKAEISINRKNTTYSYNDILEGKLTTVNLNSLTNANKGRIIPVEVYPSDYYYRISDYKIGSLNARNEYAKEAGNDKTIDDELEVLVTYKVRLFAATAGKSVKINQIAYYYDQNYDLVTVRGGSISQNLDANLSQIDGMKGIMINGSWDVSSGEHYIYLTFRVKEYNDAMYKGNIKGHVATVTSYSTSEGLLDIDSAIRNVRDSGQNKNVITDVNQIQFEDDTAIAEKIEIKFASEARTISGNVFDDLDKDGMLDNGETIKDIVVQLIEITKNNNEYIWQETKAGTNKVESLVKTSENEFTGIREYRNSLNENNNGQYEFKDIVPGNYIVRFIYGDGYNYDITVNNTKYNGADYKSTKDANYRAEWYNTTNYFGTGSSVARDNEARRLEVMATTSEIDAGLGTALEIYAENKKLADLTDAEKANIVLYIKQLSSKQDNELYAAISKVFNTTSMTTIKNTADNVEVNNLNDNYLNALKKCIAYKTFMIAETSKINVPIDTNTLINTASSTAVQCSGYVYNKIDIKFPNVNFGIMLRPKIKLELEKHITALKITPNGTGVKPIIDARADIAKILEINKGSVSPTGETKGLATIKSTRDNRGSWYVQTKTGELVNGANLEVEYTYVVKNTGEEDYISQVLANEYSRDPSEYSAYLKNRGTGLKTQLKGKTDKYGDILGTYYYTGNKGTDVLVASRVELLGEAINNNLRYDADTSGSSFKKVNEEGKTVQRTIYNVESKKEIENIDTVVETTSPSKFLTPGMIDVSKTINLSKVLPSLNINQGENISSYIAEILKYSSVSGTRNLEATPGNLTYVHSKDTARTMETDNEKDEFWGEAIIISNPTGENKILPVQIGITVVASVAVIGVGLVLMKKYVLIK